MPDLSNIRAVARREYVTRSRTRAFRLTTVVLLLATLALSQAPLLFRWIDAQAGPTTIEVSIGDSKPAIDIPTQLAAILNTDPLAAATGGGSGGNPSPPKYRIEPVSVTGVDAARARLAGEKHVAGVLLVGRDATSKDLVFTYVTGAAATDRTAATIRQALGNIAVQDRLAAAGISPPDQAKLFSPPAFTTVSTKPATPGAPTPGNEVEALVSGLAVGFVLAIVLFLAIIIYGQWIAYSVAEEKTSRVMEVILGAASPFELLGGKILGVGGLAITQYVIVFVPSLIAILFQSQIAAIVLGGTPGSVSLPAGLTPSLLAAFGIFFVLGFALYSVLYAGAAALVSRTEDINQIVAPMTFLSTGGYLAAVWSATGVVAPDSPIVVAMSFIPFFSPYLMLSRLGAGQATLLDVVIAIVLLALTVPVALWVAARLYAAGVLMYGQRPSVRLLVRALRGV
jgi:ABC-2 type transport system permease protein